MKYLSTFSIHASAWNRAHQKLAIVILALSFIVLFLIISKWRARSKDLIAKGFADQTKKSILAFRFRKDIFLFRYNRSLSPLVAREHFRWLKEKFNVGFVVAEERNWPRYFFMQSYFQFVAETFPEKIPFEAKSADEWKLVLGLNGKSTIASTKLDNISFIYICGDPGSGKSALMRIVANQFKEIKILTPKPFDFLPKPSLDYSTVENLEAVVENLEFEIAEMDRRKQLMIDARVTHIKNIEFSPRAIMIDEAHRLFNTSSWDKEQKEVIQKIISLTRRLIREARSYGIIVILGTQKGRSTETEIGSVKDGILIAGRVDTNAISEELIGSNEACDSTLPPGIFFLRDSKGVTKFKAFYQELEEAS